MTDYTDRSAEALLARRAIAEKATPGLWGKGIAIRRGYGVTAVLDSEGNNIADMEHSQFTEKEEEFNADHIAACDPSTVVADIDELLRLREENERLAGVLEVQLQEAAVELLNGAIKMHTKGNNHNVFSLGMTCPHCNLHFSTVEEAVAHDAACQKHPASIRAERLEKEADWLARAAANGGWHRVRVSPKQMRDEARKALGEEA